MPQNQTKMQVVYSTRERKNLYHSINSSAKYDLIMSWLQGAREIPLGVAFHAFHHVEPEGVTLLYHSGQSQADITVF